MRCLSLAEGLREAGSEFLFVTKNYQEAVNKISEKRYLVEVIPTDDNLGEDLEKTVKIIKENKPDAVVIDSYDIGENYLRRIKNTGALLVNIDDSAQLHFCSDVVVNQNINAKESHYSIEEHTKLLLGPKYALLRKEFGEKHKQNRTISSYPEHILITLGGADPKKQTLKVLIALENVSRDLIVTIVSGIHCLYKEELESLVKKSKHKITVKENAQNISDLMLKADLAISAGGTTTYELACLGLPNIVLVLADNQKRIAEEWSKQGISINLGECEKVKGQDISQAVESLLGDKGRRETMSKKGKEMVDGRGAERVIREICTVEKACYHRRV